MPQAVLTIYRYPAWAAFAGFMSMAVFRLPLWLNKQVSFYKLMGCGRNGSFDIRPDWRQWAIMTVSRHPFDTGGTVDQELLLQQHTGRFIQRWARFFRCEVWTLILEPVEGHGTWDGQQAFGNLPHQSGYEGPVAVLTRATIRLSRLRHFWNHVAPVSARMADAPGFITSVGIGEVPWIKQATFSVWTSKKAMKEFAYSMKEHQEVIRLTRKERWYSEDMFVRFRVLASLGSLHGRNPLSEKLYL